MSCLTFRGDLYRWGRRGGKADGAESRVALVAAAHCKWRGEPADQPYSHEKGAGLGGSKISKNFEVEISNQHNSLNFLWISKKNDQNLGNYPLSRFSITGGAQEAQHFFTGPAPFS